MTLRTWRAHVIGDEVGGLLTMDHSRARPFMRLVLLSSAYSAPIREPMEVPPTRSMGMPDSIMALMMPI